MTNFSAVMIVILFGLFICLWVGCSILSLKFYKDVLLDKSKKAIKLFNIFSKIYFFIVITPLSVVMVGLISIISPLLVAVSELIDYYKEYIK